MTCSIIISIPEEWEFIFYRRFNYVTCIYVTNRYVLLNAGVTLLSLKYLILSANQRRYRLSATLCLIGYFILTVTTPLSCQAISAIVPTSEAITLFTSCALLVIRYAAMNY
jgi:hypothetical protein